MNGAFGIIFSENKDRILLVKRRDIPIWVLPGGGTKREKPEQTVIREVFEETGYKVEIIRKVGKYKYKKSKKVNYTYICVIKGGKRTLSNESQAIEYFRVDNLPNMMSPFAPVMISDALRAEPKLIEHSFDKLPISFWIRGVFHPWALLKYLLTRIGVHWNT